MRTHIGIAGNDPSAAIIQAETAIGARFVGRRVNSSTAYPLFKDQGVIAAGGMLFRNCNVESGNAPMFGGWAGVAQGNADAYIREGYRAWKNSGLLTPQGPKLLLSVHHEQKVNSASQCGVGCNGDALDYIAMFRRWVDLAVEEGVREEILFCYVPAVKQYKTLDDPLWGARTMDPGPEYVDIYGADSYTYAVGSTLTHPSPYEQGIDVVGQYAAERDRLAMLGEFSVRGGTLAGTSYLSDCCEIWETQGNWFGVFTDTDAMTPNLIPVWQDTLGDPLYGWFGEIEWPGGTAPPPPPPPPDDCAQLLAAARLEIARLSGELASALGSLDAATARALLAEGKLEQIKGIVS